MQSCINFHLNLPNKKKSSLAGQGDQQCTTSFADSNELFIQFKRRLFLEGLKRRGDAGPFNRAHVSVRHGPRLASQQLAE